MGNHAHRSLPGRFCSRSCIVPASAIRSKLSPSLSPIKCVLPVAVLPRLKSGCDSCSRVPLFLRRLAAVAAPIWPQRMRGPRQGRRFLPAPRRGRRAFTGRGAAASQRQNSRSPSRFSATIDDSCRLQTAIPSREIGGTPSTRLPAILGWRSTPSTVGSTIKAFPPIVSDVSGSASCPRWMPG